jgi:hypothetical protein
VDGLDGEGSEDVDVRRGGVAIAQHTHPARPPPAPISILQRKKKPRQNNVSLSNEDEVTITGCNFNT